jgi:lipopolysaccharide/colanic/teichoic acid biosynthesis glycosyltransferase
LVLGAAERAAALLLAAALAPVLGIIALVIWLLARRPPLVCHLRIGRQGHPFWMLKFRTMWNGEPRIAGGSRLVEFVRQEPGPKRKNPHDPRIRSRFARLCRRYSIDELPQLLHVTSGCMSLVGPRPLTRSELRSHYGPQASEVLQVKPGITGLWQVMGRSRLTYRQRRRLDLFYIHKRSVGLDLAILARTIPRVLSGKDSWWARHGLTAIVT